MVAQIIPRSHHTTYSSRYGKCNIALEGEHIINNIRGLFALEPADVGDCCRSNFVLLFSPVFTCFPHLKYWNLNDLVLISFCVARGAGVLRPNATSPSGSGVRDRLGIFSML